MKQCGHLGVRRSSAPHLQVISLGAIIKRRIRSLDIKNAFQRAGGFGRDVFLRAHTEWDPSSVHLIWKQNAPAYKLNDAPVAFRQSLRKYFSNFVASLAKVGLRLQVLASDPRLRLGFQKRLVQFGFSPPDLMKFLGVAGRMSSPRAAHFKYFASER